jgi:MFS family permease
VDDDPADAGELAQPGMRDRAAVLLKMAWVGNALAYVAINVLIPVMLRLATESGVTDLAAAGAITSVWSFTRFAAFGLVWWWVGWHYNVRWLLAAQFALALTFFAMLTWHWAPALVVAQILFGLATALVYSSSLYYAMHVSDGHGGHAGLHEALIGLGIAVGPTIGALAGTGELGPAALWRIAVGVTALLLLGTGVMAWMARRK